MWKQIWVSIGIFLALSFSLSFIPGLSPPTMYSLSASRSKLIPQDAQFFYLNVSNPTYLFSLAQFTPDQSFIGYYNIQIDCLLYVNSYDPNCTVICQNLWNASDPAHFKLTGDILHSTYSYSYSRPTGSDPDFAVCLTLSAGVPIQTPPVEGWVCLRVTDGGTTTLPPNFVMPNHLNNCTTNSVSNEVTSSSPLITDSSPLSVPIISLFVLLVWKKRKDRKDLRSN